jgi:hypothetical protein
MDEDVGLLSALNSAAEGSGAGRGLFSQVSSGVQAMQVDLNDPAQLGDLEDAGLMGHMEEARAQLVAQELAAAQLPEEAGLMASSVEGRAGLSTVMSALREQRAALASARDEVYLQASNSEKLAAGLTPHGFPTTGKDTFATRQSLIYLCARINSAGAQLAQICTTLEAAESELTRARRAVDTALAGHTHRSQHFKESWTALGKTLQRD